MPAKPKKKKQWFVYLVRCKDGSLYCGVTNNLQKRMEPDFLGTGVSAQEHLLSKDGTGFFGYGRLRPGTPIIQRWNRIFWVRGSPPRNPYYPRMEPDFLGTGVSAQEPLLSKDGTGFFGYGGLRPGTPIIQGWNRIFWVRGSPPRNPYYPRMEPDFLGTGVSAQEPLLSKDGTGFF